MKDFKNIVITGASSGIGEALAIYYAAYGRTLFLTGRDEARLSAVAEACRARGARVEISLIDVTSRESMACWLLQIDEASAVDLIIANAGISGGTGGAENGSWIEADYKIFEVNIMGVLHTIHPLTQRMMERKAGQIAVMSSLAGFSGWPGAPGYSASKAGVRIYGEALRGTLAPYNIGVSVICPGFVQSRMTAVNNYKMPLFMDAPRAATIIAKGLSENHARIAFPLPTTLVSGMLGLLPPAFSSWLLARFPAKPVLRVNR